MTNLLKHHLRFSYFAQFILLLIIYQFMKISNAFNVAPKASFVFTKPVKSRKSSYFGHSVALLQYRKSIWLLSGAPRANSSASKNVYEPGSFYKCQVRPTVGKCTEVILDTAKNFDFYWNGLRVLRDRAWTGAHMDVDKFGNVFICAPRWKAAADDEYRINGACYSIGPDLEDRSATIVLPLTSPKNQQYNHKSLSGPVYYYTHGQCGFGVHFLNNNETLLVGAPGVLNWHGSVIKFEAKEKIPSGGLSKREASVVYSSDMIPNPYWTKVIDDSSYFGYSVSSGYFDDVNGFYYVAGAPRAFYGYGAVFVYLMRKDQNQPLFVKDLRQGIQIGEYLGASVTTSDYDGDGFSDLAAGAPMHSIDALYDAGCVYVFMNKRREDGKTELSNNAIKLTGEASSGARFGSALGSPGDLNNDGFEDLLVGAPYENSGAVYVFMGSKGGIISSFSQKLTASEVSSSIKLQGFGISFSRSLDVDENMYPDFAVGSFLSDDAVLMLSRPVVDVSAEILAESNKISLTQKYFIVTPCLSYSGIGAPSELDIVATLAVSQESTSSESIITFSDTGSQTHQIVFVTKKNVRKCRSFRINLELTRNNAQNSVVLSMNYNLKENMSKGPENPVLNPKTPYSSNLILSFITGCKDEICRSDLSVTASVSPLVNGTLLVGSTNKIDLKVNISNIKDPAFLPNLTITVPKSLTMLPTVHDCAVTQGKDHTQAICQLKNPLKKFEKQPVLFELLTNDLNDQSDDITISTKVASASDVELNENDNHHRLRIRLKKIASIKVTGWSRPEQIMLKRKDKQKSASNESITLEHTFSIEKSEATPLREINVDVFVPISFKLKDGGIVKIAQRIENKLSFHTKTKICTLVDAKEKLSRIRKNSTSREVKVNSGISSLNCSSNNIKCARIQCTIGPWKKGYDVATLAINFVLNLTQIRALIPLKDEFSLLTGINATIAPHKYFKDIEGKRTEWNDITTIFQLSSIEAKPLAWWIYVAAVLGGILVLSIIAYILFKFGFFRRQKKEDLLIQKENLSKEATQNNEITGN